MIKKNLKSLNKYNQRRDIALWLFLHLIILTIFLISGPYKVNTQLYSILPQSNPIQELANVEDAVVSKLNGKMTVLIGHPDFKKAQAQADTFYNELSKLKHIEDIQYKIDPQSLYKIRDILHKYRYQLIDPITKKQFLKDDISSAQQNVWNTLNSPVSLGALDYLDQDPFLLSDLNFKYITNNLLNSNTSLVLKNNLLTRNYLDKNWIFISMKMSDSVGMNTDINPIPKIHDIINKIKAKDKQAEIVFSGVPFHSYSSASKSEKEITILSLLSFIFIILMMLSVFRSAKPLLIVLFSISIGIGSGLALTMSFFKEIHIFTIVFGTSLIGISVDYSFHFLSDWCKIKDSDNYSKTSWQNLLRAQIFPSIFIGLITTIISYLAFVFSDFPLLEQMALFSIAGLISAFLSVFLLYPSIGMPSDKTITQSSLVREKIAKIYFALGKTSNSFKKLVGLILALLVIFGLFNFEIKNNISNFYKMSDSMQYNEVMSAKILNHGSTGIYYLVEGDSLNDNIKIEEHLTKELDKLIKDKEIKSYLSISKFIPSEDIQTENAVLAHSALNFKILNQYQSIMPDESEDSYYNLAKKWLQDINHATDEKINIADFKDTPLDALISQLNLGLINKGDHQKHYTMILLFGVNNKSLLNDLGKKSEGVYFIAKVDEINNSLQKLSLLALIIIAISYALIAFILSIRYGIKKGFKIILIPIIASVITLYIIDLSGYDINLFAIIGLILIPGMGTDYLILLNESDLKHKKEAILSISMSMFTTLLAFGLLGFSDMAGLFGMTVGLGVFFTYLLSAIFQDYKEF